MAVSMIYCLYVLKEKNYMYLKKIIFTTIMLCALLQQSYTQTIYHEPYRPGIHFSPKEKWMNDPNGMVYQHGVYHLFFQYYPGGVVWGPMHWGHAISKDLVHWQQQPVALYPDSLGDIFSGSAVVDKNNTSGLGKGGQVPIVAAFTSSDGSGAKKGRNDFQNQSLAYSLDNGKTWIKYSSNPVLKNPGIIDFRDPKVMWYEADKKWIMTLATKDRVSFYSSADLKKWTKESEFGKESGAHGGVWECPDLFKLDYKGTDVWVLLVSINPGGPNGGSATQYFTGSFDGKTFTANSTAIKWLDYGRDDYAGVTWSNTGDRKIFMGWMSNWQYAERVPTQKWRGATTVPRDLSIDKVGGQYYLSSQPVKELDLINSTIKRTENVKVKDSPHGQKIAELKGAARLHITSDQIKCFSLSLSNDLGEKIVIGYDRLANRYFIDRTGSGKMNFESSFAGRHTAPRIADKAGMDLTLIIDTASVELFADNGLCVMTEIFFPNTPYRQIRIESAEGILLKSVECTDLKNIWQP